MKFREFLLNESEKVQPKTKRELKNIIQKTIEGQGLNCDLNFIDVSLIKDMSNLFKDSKFNGDISKWDVSNVADMSYMFAHADSFNQPLDKWNTSKVTNMKFMFWYAESFNQSISKWNTSELLICIECSAGPTHSTSRWTSGIPPMLRI